MRFWTSDHHFSHANIVGYCGRPYDNVSEMNGDLVERWNAVVGDGDIVMYLGDLWKIGPVAQLNGQIILVRGNHDRMSAAELKALGVQEAKPGTWAIGDGSFHKTVKVSHYPYELQDREEKFKDRRPTDRGGWLFHGHVHEKWRQRGRQINVGVDAWGGYPVPEEHLIKMIEDGPQDLRPIPW